MIPTHSAMASHTTAFVATIDVVTVRWLMGLSEPYSWPVLEITRAENADIYSEIERSRPIQLASGYG